MWKTFVILTQLLSFCFASSGPKIVAEVDYALQNKELQSCIIETTEHFIQEKANHQTACLSVRVRYINFALLP